MRRALASLSLGLLTTVALAAEDTPLLRVGLSTAWAAPFLSQREGQAPEGLNAELAHLLAQQLKRKATFVMLPRARLDQAAEAGEIDLRCHANPDWVRQPGMYEWSQPLWALPEVLVGSTNSAPLQRLADMRLDQTVGAVLHYSYPMLDAQFGAGTWKRDDAPAPDKALRKLALGRTQYAVTTQFELSHYLREQPDPPLGRWRLPLGHANAHCAVPRASKVRAADVFAALQALREQGLLDALLRRHGIPTVAVVAAAQSELPALGRDEVEALFLRRLKTLEDGRVPQLLVPGDAWLAPFAEQVLRRSAAQLRAEWSRATFSGGSRKPLQLDTPSQLRAQLRRQPLAIGVLPLHELDASLKILYLP
ncbi:substrate-binding periplasmic protein [Inhella proteolytica]|uniref:Transporter substrate-binding domain-containing protein n=1 Tax=Inhella proteolytica TaxID=2795029 RepID=A0A931J5J1_9BURK|nr:transporter substrate-binding domain-containing protein [Inhella proteolytica]MBH9578203.1 transporter substrate-binding domain-containing protein [Inhella proteolytica]